MRKIYLALLLAVVCSFSIFASPTITSFSPISGTVGTTVTISGTNFNTTASNNIVFFGATKATVTEASSTSLTVTVPNGAKFQYITVTDLITGLTAYSTTPFNYTCSDARGNFGAKVDYATNTNPRVVSICDLNNDGKPDMAVANYGSSNLSVYINNGSGSFAAKVDYATGSNPISVSTGDLNGDGYPDLAVVNFSSNTLSIFINNGSGSFAAKVDYATGSNPYATAISDLNADGKPDVAVANYGTGTMSVFINSGSGVFAPKVDYGAASPVYVSVGDFNSDGKPDLATANYTANSVSVFNNNGDGTFAARVNYNVGSTVFSVSTGDLNSDGKLDLVATNFGSNTISVLMNNGDGTFAGKVDYATLTQPFTVSIGDLNGDGKLDLAVANYGTSYVSIFKNNSDGTFATKVDYSTGSTVYCADICDVNSDGKPDLAVTNNGANTVSVLTNIAFPPTISSYTPTTAGYGTTVTITGTNLSDVTAVSFGGTAALSFTVVSPTSITADVALGTSGSVSVTSSGGTATSAGFTFVSTPAISSFSPTTAEEGNLIRISGTYFTGATALSFGGTAAKSFTVINDNTIVAFVSAGTSGSVSITNAIGTGTKAGFTFKPFLSGPYNALTLDGSDDYIDCGTNITSALAGTNLITVEAWTYLSVNTGLPTIVGNYKNGDGMQFLMRIDNNKPTFWIGIGGHDWISLSATSNMPLNKWTHLAGTWDGSEMKIYVNGELQGSTARSGTFPALAYSVRIGLNFSAEIWNGKLDEIRIWNVARSEIQIRENMMRHLVGNEAGLLACYSFDEESGTTAYDLISSQNNGTLLNMDGTSERIASTAYNTWTGATSSAWNTAGNWSLQSVPISTDNVGIYKWTGGNEATLSGNPTVNNLLISSTFGGTINSQFTTNGNLLINGTTTLFGNNTETAITGNVGISAGGTLSIPFDGRISITGNAINNGTLTLKSDVSGNGTVLNSGTFSGTGTYNAEQYFLGGTSPAGRSYYISSPTTTAKSSVFAPNGTTTKMQSYNEGTKAFSNITNSTTDLNPMEGYFMRLSDATATKTFTGGAFNTGSMSDGTLSRTAGVKEGFNLVGNPYPSYLDWDAVHAASTNLETTIWFRTASANTVAGMCFDTYNKTGSVGTNNNGGGVVTKQIPPNQAFWVRVAAGQTTGTIAFTNAMRSHQSGKLRTSESEPSNLLRLAISDGISRDETLILFNENASDDYEAYDSEKMMGSNAAQCYTFNNEGEMVINTFASLSGIKSVPVGIQILTNGQHSFSANDLSSFDVNTSIFLEDRTTGIFTDLRTTPSYSFETNSGVNNDRFVVHFGLLFTDINGPNAANSSIYSFDQSVYVHAANNGIIQITDLSGRIVLSQSAKAGMNAIKLNNAGVYMVKLINGNEVKVHKIVIK